MAIVELRTMDQALSDTISARRQIMTLVDFFGAIALLLAALGLAGVMWYSVSQRTHEIGVRMALGAVGGDVLRLVIGRALQLALGGIGIGLAVAWGATRLLTSLLYGVTPKDPAVLVLAPLVLLAVTLAAGYIPARRAAAVDPVAALRHE